MQSLTRARPGSRFGCVLYSSSPTNSFPSGEEQMLAGLLMSGALTNVVMVNPSGTFAGAGASASAFFSGGASAFFAGSGGFSGGATFFAVASSAALIAGFG